LLINAAQAIAPGNLEGNRVSISTRTDGQGRVVIDVADTGSGIEPEVLSRIFEPFFTTKAAGVGTGLGLSICHGIAASMGGSLDVESRVGEGTTFHLTLPTGAHQEPSLSPPTQSVPASRRGRILLIDDEDMVLNAIARILNEHEMVCTQDAGEALARLERDQRFDIIFCDLMMPKMTGIDFYEALLRVRPELAKRVVFLSGGAVTAKAARFLDTVPNQRIEKPFQVQELRRWVQQSLAHGGPN
jgi:CheY-like chemotaxis protein